MSWLATGLGLLQGATSIGSSIFSVSNALSQQKEQRELYRESLRQRAEGLRTQGTNYSGDVQSMVRHLFGTGGVQAALSDQEEQINEFYDKSIAEMQNLFNYAGSSGPRAQVILDQIERQRGEDIEALGENLTGQIESGQIDILNSAYNAYESLTEAQGGSITPGDQSIMAATRGGGYWAGGDTGTGRITYATQEDAKAAQAASSFVENNRDFLEGVGTMAKAIREGQIDSEFISDQPNNVQEAAQWAQLFNKITPAVKDKDAGTIDMDKINLTGEDEKLLNKMGFNNLDTEAAVSQLVKQLGDEYDQYFFS